MSENLVPLADSIPTEDVPPRDDGRIITFYSYKGGTGRSMALANVAWILANHGLRVAVIDWDLEAPGLHRYFRPFLSDPELTGSPGLIDFFIHFTESARQKQPEPREGDDPWFYAGANLMRYALPLDYRFPNGGRIDFVSAGQQGPSYGLRVNTFQWGDFYQQLGGGTFIEAVKQHLRSRYDVTLIDSRTGLSDTSGICTVQMPSELVVCFTMNRQSIYGAAATVASADAQRRLPTGEPGLKIWPVPTRVEFSETDRLDAARVLAREQFAQFLWHLPVQVRSDYWNDIEVPYLPYYAFEEVLATIKDQPKPRTSLLTSMERLATRLMKDWLEKQHRTEMVQPKLDIRERDRLLQLFQRRPGTGLFFVSFATADEPQDIVARLIQMLDVRFGRGATFMFDRIPLGGDFDASIKDAVTAAETVIVLVGPNWHQSRGSATETSLALSAGKTVIPVFIQGATAMPTSLATRRAFVLDSKQLDADIARLGDLLEAQLPRDRTMSLSASVDVDDPHKGQFGGDPEVNDRALSAHVIAAPNEWFELTLAVDQTDPTKPLVGDVEFYLHPSFRPAVIRVAAVKGRASLKLRAWGAFTVGAIADNGQTRLELDLSTINAPKAFRER